MQRKLLALAVASAFAVPGAAFAQVTISGALRYSVDNVDFSDPTSTSTVNNTGAGVNKWGMTGHSANIKFQSRESLGGGLTAWMALESGVGIGRTNGGNFGWFGRNTGVGIDSTSWGTVMMGQWDAPYKSIDGVWSIGTPAAYSYSATAPIFGRGDTTGTMPNPNCSYNLSGAGTIVNSTTTPATVCANSAGGATAFQRRLSSTVQWWSPVWNGVQLLLATQTNSLKTSGNSTNTPAGVTVNYDPSMWSGAVRWAGPRWGVVGGYEQHKNFNANAAGTNRLGTDQAWKIGGNYNFGPVQVSLAYENLRYEVGTVATPTDHKEDNWYIGGAFPIGNGAIRAAYSDGSVKGSNFASTSNANGKLYNLSYEYNLSKRTMVYAAYAQLKQDSGSARQFGTNIEGVNGWQTAIGAGSDARYISFGMNHNF